MNIKSKIAATLAVVTLGDQPPRSDQRRECGSAAVGASPPA